MLILEKSRHIAQLMHMHQWIVFTSFFNVANSKIDSKRLGAFGFHPPIEYLQLVYFV